MPSADLSDPNRNLRVQDRAEIGEGQLGVSMQKKSMQASLALVQRTVKSQIGPFKKSVDESFARPDADLEALKLTAKGG